MRNVACLSMLFLLTISMGCRIDPSAEREIALLRSEILDLEDQYYSLKSQCGTTAENNIDGDIQYYDGGQNVEYLPQGDPGIIVGEDVMLNEPLHSPSGQIYGAAGGRFGQTIESCDCPTQGLSYAQNYQPNVIFNEPAVNPNQPAPSERISAQSEEYQTRLPESIVDRDTELDSYRPGIASLRGQERREPQTRESDLAEIEFDDFDANEYSLSPPQNEEVGVAGINIDRIASGGQDLDGIPGHEGLVLLIQPESIDGEVVQTSGRLSIEVTDPKLRRPRNSIASWQFSPHEVQNFFVKEQLSEQGILLHLPWDRNAPENRKLLVHVEFTTNDDRVFEATREFEIEPPEISYSPEDPIISQWVERDKRWKDLPSSQPQNFANKTGTLRSRIPTRPASSQRQVSQPEWRPVR